MKIHGTALEHWQPVSWLFLADIKVGFQFDAAYQQHERGEIAATDYFAHLCHSLQLQEGHARIAESRIAIFTGEIAETLAMVRAARSQLPCYAFSMIDCSVAKRPSSLPKLLKTKKPECL